MGELVVWGLAAVPFLVIGAAAWAGAERDPLVEEDARARALAARFGLKRRPDDSDKVRASTREEMG